MIYYFSERSAHHDSLFSSVRPRLTMICYLCGVGTLYDHLFLLCGRCYVEVLGAILMAS